MTGKQADIRRYVDMTVVREPQRNSTGGTLHGQVSAGPYIYRIWSYPEFYDTTTQEHISYLNDDKVIVLPENPTFTLSFGGVPQLRGRKAIVGASLGDTGVTFSRGEYLVGEYFDEKNDAHNIDLKSAGVAVPVSVDQIYTMKVR